MVGDLNRYQQVAMTEEYPQVRLEVEALPLIWRE